MVGKGDFSLVESDKRPFSVKELTMELTKTDQYFSEKKSGALLRGFDLRKFSLIMLTNRGYMHALKQNFWSLQQAEQWSL